MSNLLITDPVHRERVLRWAELLESGRFEQCHSRLREEYGAMTEEVAIGHCCLGVACVQYNEETGQGGWVDEHTFRVEAVDGFEEEAVDTILPAAVARWLFGDSGEFDPDLVDEPSGLFPTICATEANDDVELTFEEIARVIRVELLGEELDLPQKLQDRKEAAEDRLHEQTEEIQA